jgi:hypothetical protein
VNEVDNGLEDTGNTIHIEAVEISQLGVFLACLPDNLGAGHHQCTVDPKLADLS